MKNNSTTRAESVLEHMKAIGMNPTMITDGELMKLRNVGRDTVVEIRRLTGPCDEIYRTRRLYGFESWWRYVGKKANHGPRLSAKMAWDAKKDEPVIVTDNSDGWGGYLSKAFEAMGKKKSESDKGE